jgi:hypothetical protein
MANRIKNKDPTICSFQETHLIDRNKHCLRGKMWKKICQTNGPTIQAGVAVPKSGKVNSNLN